MYCQNFHEIVPNENNNVYSNTWSCIHIIYFGFLNWKYCFLFANKITQCLNIKAIEIILETVTDIYSITLNELSINITFTHMLQNSCGHGGVCFSDGGYSHVQR